MVVVDRLIDVGQRLRLDALAGVDHQQRALAGGERAVDLVGEVDMAGRVDQVEDVVLAVARLVVEPHGLRLDGDAALALDVHRIEHLLDHLARLEPAGELDQPVGERRLAVVDMGDDREIADVVDGDRRHGAADNTACRTGKRRNVDLMLQYRSNTAEVRRYVPNGLAMALCLCIILSENRCPLFGIMQ